MGNDGCKGREPLTKEEKEEELRQAKVKAAEDRRASGCGSIPGIKNEFKHFQKSHHFGASDPWQPPEHPDGAPQRFANLVEVGEEGQGDAGKGGGGGDDGGDEEADAGGRGDGEEGGAGDVGGGGGGGGDETTGAVNAANGDEAAAAAAAAAAAVVAG